jgi:hypothetical protein
MYGSPHDLTGYLPLTIQEVCQYYPQKADLEELQVRETTPSKVKIQSPLTTGLLQDNGPAVAAMSLSHHASQTEQCLAGSLRGE